jgi:hypothetical protein
VTRRQRILVVLVAAVIVVLYLVAVACQARSGAGGREAGQRGPIALLGEWFGPWADVDPADVAADCQQPDGRLVFEHRCAVEVAPGGSLRLVPLWSEQAVAVRAPAPAGDFTMDTGIDPGDTVRVAVGGRGAKITLTCLGPDPCEITIGAGDG